MEVGGESQQANIARSENKVVITVGEMTATVAAVDDAGNTRPLDSAGNIVLEPGARVAVKMDGFDPGTEMEIWMYSTPVRIGTAKVGANGELDTVVAIPDDAPSGAHRIVITSKGENPVKFTLGVRVGSYGKESNVATWLIVVPIVVAVLSALFLPPAFRRRRRAA